MGSKIRLVRAQRVYRGERAITNRAANNGGGQALLFLGGIHGDCPRAKENEQRDYPKYDNREGHRNRQTSHIHISSDPVCCYEQAMPIIWHLGKCVLFSVLTANVRLLGLLFRQDRKFDSKSCACCVALEPYFTLTPDGDDAAHHVQSEARSLTYVLCREKWIKDMSLYLLQDT